MHVEIPRPGFPAIGLPLLALVTAGAAIACAGAATTNASQIDAAHLREELATPKAPLVLDVRTPAEFTQGHVPGAVLLPLGEIGSDPAAAARKVEELARGRPVAVICRSGRRSARAIELLEKAGIRADLLDVRGGTNAWSQAGFSLEKP